MKLSVVCGLAALCLVAAPIAAQAADVKFDLVNNSTRAVTNFFTSPVDTTNWEEDVLGEDTIAPGGTDTITISTADDQCSYDMRFVMDDQAELLAKAVDVCNLNSYTLNDAK
jgi:hypothetical protein